MVARPLLFTVLLMMCLLAACSNNVVPQPSATALPAEAGIPTTTPAPVSTPTSTTTPTPPSSPTATLPPLTLTFKPVADSYVEKSNPNGNFGTSNGLRVDASPEVDTYLRFTLKGVGPRTISRVRLLIYAYSASTQGIAVKTVADNTWGERTITANDAPALGNILAISPPVGARTWITYDVTSYVTSENTFSFGLSTPGSKAISLAARESVVYSPQLIVDLH